MAGSREEVEHERFGITPLVSRSRGPQKAGQGESPPNCMHRKLAL